MEINDDPCWKPSGPGISYKRTSRALGRLFNEDFKGSVGT